MLIRTTRFGPIDADQSDLITFPSGLIGLEDCRRWLLLADGANDALAWLQSASRPETALAVVSPRRFVPDYRFRVNRSELAPLELASLDDAQVLVTLARHDFDLTLNLKAPIVINLRTRIGRQVAANDDLPLQYVLPVSSSRLRKIA